MKLTARQREFLEIAKEGYACPYDMPPGGPFLKNEEINPLIDAKLIKWTVIDDRWDITPAGSTLLTEQPSWRDR